MGTLLLDKSSKASTLFISDDILKCNPQLYWGWELYEYSNYQHKLIYVQPFALSSSWARHQYSININITSLSWKDICGWNVIIVSKDFVFLSSIIMINDGADDNYEEDAKMNGKMLFPKWYQFRSVVLFCLLFVLLPHLLLLIPSGTYHQNITLELGKEKSWGNERFIKIFNSNLIYLSLFERAIIELRKCCEYFPNYYLIYRFIHDEKHKFKVDS